MVCFHGVPNLFGHPDTFPSLQELIMTQLLRDSIASANLLQEVEQAANQQVAFVVFFKETDRVAYYKEKFWYKIFIAVHTPTPSSSAIALRPHRTLTSKDSSSIQDVGQNISLVSCNNLHYTITIDGLITIGSEIYFDMLQGSTMSTALEYSDASVCSLAVEFSTKSTVQQAVGSKESRPSDLEEASTNDQYWLCRCRRLPF